MGPGQNFLTWVRSNFCCSVQVGSDIFDLGMDLEIFPSESKKMSSGQAKKYPDQSRVGLLFTAGQKYVWVRSGPISTPTPTMDCFCTSFSQIHFPQTKFAEYTFS